MPNALAEAGTGASPRTQKLLIGWLWALRIAVPPLLIIVLSQTIPAAIDAGRALFGGN
jgi:hypothetical protein